MRRWPRERKSDNPFLVFCFILPELPLKKNSYHQKVHERHSAALHSLCCNNGSRCLAEGKLIKMVHRTAAFYKELLSELEAIFT